jgi:transcription elongation factor GreA
MPRTPMTRTGYDKLKEELERLKRVERPAIIKAIAEARAHGDLSENAEYHAAREKQSFTEGRINELDGKVGAAEVIDVPVGGDRVTFASTVRLEDEKGKGCATGSAAPTRPTPPPGASPCWPRSRARSSASAWATP